MGKIHWHFEVPLGTYLKFLVNVQGKHVNIKEAGCKQKGYIQKSMLANAHRLYARKTIREILYKKGKEI